MKEFGIGKLLQNDTKIIPSIEAESKHMSGEMLIGKKEVIGAFKEMAEDSLAFAIVAKDGSVAFQYAMEGNINKDPHAAARIIKTVAELVAHSRESK